MAIYMKFGSVAGNVTTDKFKDWIELSSVQAGVTRATGSGAGGAQREGSNPSITEITITKHNDLSSAKLYNDAIAGHFDTKVEIKFTATTKNGVETFLAYELKQCGVSSFHLNSVGDNPTESLSLNFTHIMISPSPLDDKGSPKAGAKISYDLLKLVAS